MLFVWHVYHYAGFYLLYPYAVFTQLYLYATSLPSHLYAVFYAAQSLCHGSCNSITMPLVMLLGHCAVGKPHSHYAMGQWWAKIAPKFARRRPGGVRFIMLIRAELKGSPAGAAWGGARGPTAQSALGFAEARRGQSPRTLRVPRLMGEVLRIDV